MTLEGIAANLTVMERVMMLFCLASNTDWQRQASPAQPFSTWSCVTS
jgi:hypothetical protein